MKARTTQFLRFRASAGAVGSIHAVWNDQRETEHERGRRSRKREQAELARPLLHAENVERYERESDRERVQQHQLKGQRVARRTEPVGQARRCDGRADEQDAVDGQQEEEQRAGEPLARSVVRAVVPEPHERSVHAPAEEELRDRFDRAEECQDPVVLLRQVLDVDTEQREVDDLDGDVAKAVDRQVLR